MNDSRLIELLRAFTIEEFKSFEKFLNSPFLSPSGKVIEFYKVLKKYAPKFERNINKITVFKKLYPAEDFNESKLINLMKSLMRSAESFLVHMELQKGENEIEFLLNSAKIYIDRKMPKNAMRVIKDIEKMIKPGSLKKDDNSRNRRLAKLKIRYYTEYKDDDKEIESMKEYFEVSSINFFWDALDIKLSIKPIGTIEKNIETAFIKGVLDAFDFDKLIFLVDEKEKEKEVKGKEVKGKEVKGKKKVN